MKPETILLRAITRAQRVVEDEIGIKRCIVAPSKRSALQRVWRALEDGRIALDRQRARGKRKGVVPS